MENKEIVDAVEVVKDPICEICPVLTVKHDSGESTSLKYCFVKAALKAAAENYPVCDQELNVTFNKVEEAIKPVEVVAELEPEVEVLPVKEEVKVKNMHHKKHSRR